MSLDINDKIKLLISGRPYQGVLAAALTREENPGIRVFLKKVARYCPSREAKQQELENLLYRIWYHEFERITSLTTTQVLFLLNSSIRYQTLCACLVDERQLVRETAHRLLSELPITIKLTNKRQNSKPA